MTNKKTDFFRTKKPWSLFKDEILQKYLLPYFQKIFSTNKPVLYIDCFAGKGKFDDGNPGSPIIALDVIDIALKSTKVNNPKIACFFIDDNYHDDLINNLDGRPNVNIVDGQFQDKTDNILKTIGNGNVFLYIDPFGVCDLDMNWFDGLVRSDYYSIELLLNFQANGFFRLACSAMDVTYVEGDSDDVYDYEVIKYFPKDKKVNTLDVIAGDSSWRQIVLEYKDGQIDGKEAEKRISRQYCETLRRSFEYVLEMPISDNPANKPKYRMIFATKKRDGYLLMVEIMCKQIEKMKKVHSGGQLTFLYETIENVPYDPDEEKLNLLSLVPKNKRESITEIIAKYYQKRGLKICPANLRKFVREFEKNGIIDITRVPSKRKNGKPCTFLTENKRQTVKLIRNLSNER